MAIMETLKRLVIRINNQHVRTEAEQGAWKDAVNAECAMYAINTISQKILL